MVDFAEILDRCVMDIRQGRATLASCQAQYPQYAEQLADQLPIVAQLSNMPATSLTFEKRQAIQAQLVKQAAARQSKRLRYRPQPVRPVWRRFLFAAVALIFLFGLTSWGATTASATSLPGDTLYPIKRLSEQVAVVLTPSEGQTDLHVTLAQRRLDEYESLSARGQIDPTLIVEAGSEIDTALSQIESSGTLAQQAAVEQVALQAETQLQALSEQATGLSLDQQREVQSAAAMLAANRTRMADLTKTHPAAIPPGQVTPSVAVATPLNTPTSTATAVLQPTATDPTVLLPTTDTATMPPGLVKTPKPKITPPGLVNTPKPKITPPGLVNTPKAPPPGKNK